MIQIIDGVWIGLADTAVDGRNLGPLGITALLNVAQDLRGTIGWPNIEYMQVGLVDGPGNPISSYAAAVLALQTLRDRHDRVLVCCHGGSRSMAIALMYVNYINIGYRSHSADYTQSVGCSWEHWMELLGEKVDISLPMPHDAHRIAFNEMDWESLGSIMRR